MLFDIGGSRSESSRSGVVVFFGALSTAAACGNLAYIFTLYRGWLSEFGDRATRDDPISPSHGKLPNLISVKSAQEKDQAATSRPPPNRDRRGSAVPALCPALSGCAGRLGSFIAPSLDMDHVTMRFTDFVWGQYLLGPSAVALWVSGISKLMLRQRLQRWGWISPAPCEFDRVVASLLLEGVGQLLQYRNKRETDDGRVIGHFVWQDFPMLDMDGNFQVASALIVDVDLTNKRMVHAMLDGSEISASDAMTLVWFNTISAAHVKIHSAGNWGVNLEAKDPYMRSVGVVSVMYNYFGKTVFPRLTALWLRCGLIDKDWSQISKVFDHGVRQGTPDHSAIRDLWSYSEVADFVHKIRNHFLNLFNEQKDTMPGIHGEALFIGTVLHGLDHTLMEWNLSDPLWLDIDSPRFGLMAKLGRFVRVGFVEDLPGLMFRRRFKSALSPFFKAVYTHAAKVNRKLADHMDTCIVK